MCNNIMIDDTKLVHNVLLLSRDVMFYVIGVGRSLDKRIVALLISERAARFLLSLRVESLRFFEGVTFSAPLTLGAPPILQGGVDEAAASFIHYDGAKYYSLSKYKSLISMSCRILY